MSHGLSTTVFVPYNRALDWAPMGAFCFFGPAQFRGAGCLGGPLGPFFVGGAGGYGTNDRLIALLEPVLAEGGYELVEVEFRSGQRRWGTLRVYIDGPEGIDVNDCAAASHRISDLLDAAESVSGWVFARGVVARVGPDPAQGGAFRRGSWTTG